MIFVGQLLNKSRSATGGQGAESDCSWWPTTNRWALWRPLDKGRHHHPPRIYRRIVHLIDFKLVSFCLDGFIFRTLTYPSKVYCHLHFFYSPSHPATFPKYQRHPQQQNDQSLNHETIIVLIKGHGFMLEHTFCRPDEIMLLVSFACHWLGDILHTRLHPSGEPYHHHHRHRHHHSKYPRHRHYIHRYQHYCYQHHSHSIIVRARCVKVGNLPRSNHQIRAWGVAFQSNISECKEDVLNNLRLEKSWPL